MVDYLHPSVSSRIIDNSTVFVTAQGLTVLFAAFSAPSGPDNRLQAVTSVSELNFYYGTPNMRAYGQTLYNVSNWLNAGGSALCFRVLPYLETDGNGNALQQSLYSLLIVEVGLATNTVGGVTTNTVKTRTRVLGDGTGHLTSQEELLIRTDQDINDVLLAGPAPGYTLGSSFTWFPIMAFRPLARGAYGNNYGIRFELMTSLDNTYDFRTYQLSVYQGPVNVIESFTVSTFPDAVDNSQASLFIPNVLSKYSSTVECDFSESNYDTVCAFINASAASNTLVEQALDIFTLIEQNITPTPTLHAGVVLGSGNARLAPANGTALSMGGGTDGDWLGPNSLTSLLYKAYSGEGDFIDPTSGYNVYDTHFSDVWDKNRYLIDVILDANYDPSVKVAMSNFAQTRGDFMAFLDCGFTGSAAQALTFRSVQLAINSFYSAIWAQDFTVFDPNTGAEIRVTPTYFLASLVPYVDNSFGIHWPFVGPRRGTISGFTSQSWVPDEPTKELLYLAQVNYAETTVQQTAFMSQKTSQISNSALSDVSHVRALLRIRRNLENIGQNYRFEFNDKTTWGELQYSVNQYLNTWIANRALSAATGTVYASPYDQQQRILRVKGSVSFTGIIERVMIDIVVNQ